MAQVEPSPAEPTLRETKSGQTAAFGSARSWLVRMSSLISGDDIFISYQRADAGSYVIALANKMGEHGLSCYVDQYGGEPGRTLPAGVIRALLRCSMLVVVVTPNAALSASVGDEVRLFQQRRGRGRPIVLIDVEASLAHASWSSLVEGIYRGPETPENVAQAQPGSVVVSRVLNAATFTRLKTRQRNVALGSALVVALLAGLTWVLFTKSRALDSENRRASQKLAGQEGALAKLQSEISATTRDLESQRRQVEAAREQATRYQQEASSARREAQTQTENAQSVAGSLHSQRLLATRPQAALQEAVQAFERGGTPESEVALSRALEAFIPNRQLKRHAHPVKAAVFNRDGSLVATSSLGLIRVYRTGDGRVIDELELSASDSPDEIRFSPATNQLLVLCLIEAFLWTPGSGKPALRLKVYPNTSSYSQAGHRLAVLDEMHGNVQIFRDDGSVAVSFEVSNLQRGKPDLGTPSVHFLSGDSQVLVVGQAGEMELFSAETGEFLQKGRLHGPPKYPSALHPKEESLVTVTEAGLELCDPRTLQCPPPEFEGARLSSVAFNSDGSRIALSGDVTTVVGLQRTYLGFEEWRHEGTDSTAWTAAFSARGDTLLTTTIDGREAALVSAQDGRRLVTLRDHAARVLGGIFDPTAAWLLTWAEDGDVRLWDARPTDEDSSGTLALSSQALVEASSSDRRPRNVLASPDGRSLAFLNDKSVPWLAGVDLDKPRALLADGEPLDFVVQGWGRAVRPRFDATGASFVALTADGSALLWNIRTPDARRADERALIVGAPLDGAGDPHLYFVPRYAYDLAVSRDGNRLAVIDSAFAVDVWDIASRRIVARRREPLAFGPLAMSPDGRLVGFAQSDPGRIVVWDYERDATLLDVPTASGVFLNYPLVSFDRSGKRFASTGLDANDVQVWQLVETEQGRTMQALSMIHDTGVVQDQGAAWSADGRLLLTWRPSGGPVHVWDASSGRLVTVFEGSRCSTPAFVSDSTDIAFLSCSGTITVKKCVLCAPIEGLVALAKLRLRIGRWSKR